MKKTLKILLVIILLCSMLFVLTACGEEESEKVTEASSEENKSVSSNKETPEAIVESIESLVNEGNYEDIKDFIDFNGFFACIIKDSAMNIRVELHIEGEETYEDEEDEEIDFQRLYEMLEYLDENGTSDTLEEYSSFIGELGVADEDDLESLIEEKESFIECFDEIIDEIKEAENVKIEVINMSELEEVDDNIYSMDIEVSYEAEYEGEDYSGEDEDTIYFMEIDGEYYVIYSKWNPYAYLSDLVLERVSNAREETDKASAQDVLNMAVSSVTTEYMTDSAMSVEIVDLEDYITKSSLEKEMQNGYEIKNDFSFENNEAKVTVVYEGSEYDFVLTISGSRCTVTSAE